MHSVDTHNCRTHKAFETLLKKGAKGTEYILPTETLVMMNVIVDFKNQVIYIWLLIIIKLFNVC